MLYRRIGRDGRRGTSRCCAPSRKAPGRGLSRIPFHSKDLQAPFSEGRGCSSAKCVLSPALSVPSFSHPPEGGNPAFDARSRSNPPAVPSEAPLRRAANPHRSDGKTLFSWFSVSSSGGGASSADRHSRSPCGRSERKRSARSCPRDELLPRTRESCFFAAGNAHSQKPSQLAPVFPIRRLLRVARPCGARRRVVLFVRDRKKNRAPGRERICCTRGLLLSVVGRPVRREIPRGKRTLPLSARFGFEGGGEQGQVVRSQRGRGRVLSAGSVDAPNGNGRTLLFEPGFASVRGSARSIVRSVKARFV